VSVTASASHTADSCPADTFISRIYDWRCLTPFETYLNWADGQLVEADYGRVVKRRNKQDWVDTWKTVLLPVPYVRLVEQFLFEDRHGAANDGHEAFRRQVYAGNMLDEFTKEVMQYKGDPKDFRSFVLTPVLQRQLRGIPDSYYPLIAHALTEARTEHTPTIGDATTFYLGVDPINPTCIATFRRNLVYIREARWHLACRMGHAEVDSIDTYNWFIENHDTIMKGISPRVPGEFPKFNLAEVELLHIEGLHPLFKTELSRVVRIHALPDPGSP